jgi:hypothetical protein
VFTSLSKFVKSLEGRRMIRQFHEFFFQSNFWRVFLSLAHRFDGRLLQRLLVDDDDVTEVAGVDVLS